MDGGTCAMKFPNPDNTKEISNIQTNDIIENSTHDHLLIDCREPDEYESGHIEGAELAPLSNLEMEVETLFADESEFAILYCQHGKRSEKAVEILRSKGYCNTFSLQGGIHKWQEEINPINT